MGNDIDEDGENIVVIPTESGDPKVTRDVPMSDVARVLSGFDSSWADRAERALKTRNEILQASLDRDTAVELYIVQNALARADSVLADDLSQRPEDEHRSRIDAYHRLGGSGSLLGYDLPGFEGTTVFVTGWWPNLSWSPYRFNDRISSVKAWGGNAICEHSWYRGRKWWTVGYNEVRDLREVGFDNLATSVFGF